MTTTDLLVEAVVVTLAKAVLVLCVIYGLVMGLVVCLRHHAGASAELWPDQSIVRQLDRTSASGRSQPGG